MRLLEFIDYTISPVLKFLICGILALAIFIVHFWEPRRKRKLIIPKNQGILNDLEFDPAEYSQDMRSLIPAEEETLFGAHSETLEALDDYIKALKRHQINSIDEV